MKFTLDIDSHLIGKVKMVPNQCSVVRTADSQLIHDFICWIEGARFYLTDKISFNYDNKNITYLFELRKHIKVLKFNLTQNEKAGMYYQQRYHATENEDLILLRDFLGEIKGDYYLDFASRLGLSQLLNEKINMLSTGEFRKALILKAAVLEPKLLFVNEPYVGIDSQSCELLNELFEHLVRNGASVLIFTSKDKYPEITTQVVEIQNKTSVFDTGEIENIQIPQLKEQSVFEYAFILENIVAQYHGRDVLHQVNWKVKRNEKWALTGKNGAGKSTLLSFVNADNPKTYCNNVYIFDHKRGAGQSIWDVKEQIGFYSPELQRYFNKQQTVGNAIKSIVFQHPYKKRELQPDELLFMEQLLQYFELNNTKSKMLFELSPVMQRLVILSGILIKNVPLLILDEPFHGFSDVLLERAKSLFEKYSLNRTLVMVSHNNMNFLKNIKRRFHLTEGKGEEVCFEV